MAKKRKKAKSTCTWKSMGKGVGRRCFCGKRGKKRMRKSSNCK